MKAELKPGVVVMVVRPGSMNAGRTGVIRGLADGSERWPDSTGGQLRVPDGAGCWVVEASSTFLAWAWRDGPAGFTHRLVDAKVLPWPASDLIPLSDPDAQIDTIESKEIEHA